MKKNLLVALVAVMAVAVAGVMQAAPAKAKVVKTCANGKCNRR